jgi:hypothetical protein
LKLERVSSSDRFEPAIANHSHARGSDTQRLKRADRSESGSSQFWLVFIAALI